MCGERAWLHTQKAARMEEYFNIPRKMTDLDYVQSSYSEIRYSLLVKLLEYREVQMSRWSAMSSLAQS